ncbi:hypothetical protein C8F04DRAFT_1048936 [Mycena alexandri]|uniref:Uncharacterized protein n=1 Tax=Mycena alexandri TaxID=1745969 RepID=A0AAD6S807_9AGAR|nr:hypothetical protein C8F04DRAFT_1048936 [Mycena alexandri]
MDAIREWNGNLRSRYSLLDRCIKARERFTERFFGNDMDFGHRTFWLSLVKQREEVEALLTRLEGRGYDLVLESQNACWVRDRQPQESNSDWAEHNVENSHSDSHKEPVKDTPPTEAPPHRTSTPVDDQAAISWESFRFRMASYMLPISSRYYQERKQIVWAWICRAVYTDPALMLLASARLDVPSFLTERTYDAPTAMELHRRMKSLPLTEIRAAADDILRPKDGDSGEYVTVLGIRIHKAPSGQPFPFHAWGHFLALIPCSHCTRTLCTVVADLVEHSRYVLFTGSGRFQYPLPPEMEEIPGVEILAICGLIVEFPDIGKRVTVMKRVQPDHTTIWEEERRTPMFFAALPAGDPKAHAYLSALLRRCLTYKHLDVILRKGRDEPIIRSNTDIVGRFKRTSSSLSGLMQQRWRPSLMFQDALLELTHPQYASKFIVLDGGSGDADERYMVEDLLVCREIYSASTLLELCHIVAKSYIMANELEFDQERRQHPFIPNLEAGFIAYKDLWGSFPRWMKDREPVTFPHCLAGSGTTFYLV